MLRAGESNHRLGCGSLTGIRGILSDWRRFKRAVLAATAKPPLIFVVRIWMEFSKSAANVASGYLNKYYTHPQKKKKTTKIIKSLLEAVAPGETKRIIRSLSGRIAFIQRDKLKSPHAALMR